VFSTGWDQRLRDPKPVEELIPGYIEKHCVAYLSGPGGLHKSRIAQHWGACLHTAANLYGQVVEQGTFIHVSYENGPDEDARRQATLIRRLGLAPDALDDHIYCGWKGRSPLLIINEAADIAPTELWEALERKLHSIPGHKFIVFDSAYNVFAFAGNAKINETAVRRAIDWLDGKMAQLDASGLMVMHPSQAGIARGDNSGWSVAFVNAPRVRLAVKPVEGMDTAIELSVAKRNNTVRGAARTLYWEDGMLLPSNNADQERAINTACVDIATSACNGHRSPGTGARTFRSTARQSRNRPASG